MPFKNVLYVCSMRLPLWEFNLKILHCINIWNDGYQLYHFSRDFPLSLYPCEENKDVCKPGYTLILNRNHKVCDRHENFFSLWICICDNESNYRFSFFPLTFKHQWSRREKKRIMMAFMVLLYIFLKINLLHKSTSIEILLKENINGNRSHANNAQKDFRSRFSTQIVFNCAQKKEMTEWHTIEILIRSQIWWLCEWIFCCLHHTSRTMIKDRNDFTFYTSSLSHYENAFLGHKKNSSSTIEKGHFY